MGCPQTNLIFSQISCLIVNVYLHLQSLLTALRASLRRYLSGRQHCPHLNILKFEKSHNNYGHWGQGSLEQFLCWMQRPLARRTVPTIPHRRQLHFAFDYDGGGGSPSPPNVWVQVVDGADR